jgi:hypothetical protein
VTFVRLKKLSSRSMEDFGGFVNDVWMNILELKKNELLLPKLRCTND